MFIGHFAAGFAGKRAANQTSLGVLIAAACFLDFVWPLFLLLGWEEVRIEPGNTPFTPFNFVSYPWSHSLLMSLVWSLVFGGVYWLWTRYRAGAIMSGILVFSHWVFDWITHRPDLPLYPGSSTYLGLGLWYSVPATLAVELVMYAAGIALYIALTRANDAVGRYSLWAFL